MSSSSADDTNHPANVEVTTGLPQDVGDDENDYEEDMIDLRLRIVELQTQNQTNETLINSLQDHNSRLTELSARLEAQSVLDRQLIAELQQQQKNQNTKIIPVSSGEKAEERESEGRKESSKSETEADDCTSKSISSTQSSTEANADDDRYNEPEMKTEADGNGGEVAALKDTIEILQKQILSLVQDKSNLQMTIETLEHQLVEEKGALSNRIESLERPKTKARPLNKFRTKMKEKQQQKQVAKKEKQQEQRKPETTKSASSSTYKPSKDERTEIMGSAAPQSLNRPALKKMFNNKKKKLQEAQSQSPLPSETSVFPSHPVSVMDENFEKKRMDSASQQQQKSQSEMVLEAVEQKRRSSKLDNMMRKAATRKHKGDKNCKIDMEHYRQLYLKHQLKQQQKEAKMNGGSRSSKSDGDDNSEQSDDLFQSASSDIDMDRLKGHLDVWDFQDWSIDDDTA